MFVCSFPDLFADFPGLFANIPDLFADFTGLFANIQDLFADFPGLFANIQDLFAKFTFRQKRLPIKCGHPFTIYLNIPCSQGRTTSYALNPR
jgi:hypothetical protein